MDGCEDLERYTTYDDYRKQVFLEKETKPASTRRILTEEEFDRLRWGVGMDASRNDRVHETLANKVDAVNARLEGTLGHLYGSEGRGGALAQMEATQEKMLLTLEAMDAKFDAIILKTEQDKAHMEHEIAVVKRDVDNLGAKVRSSGAGFKKFRDAAIVAITSTVAGGVLIALWRGIQSLVAVTSTITQ